METLEKTNYKTLVNSQLEYFNSNITKDVNFRIVQLKKFRDVLKSNETLLDKAIYDDFKKSSFENYATELSIIYHEINLAIKKLKKWSKRKRVGTNMANLPGKSYIIPEPLGVTLTIGAWNYPYHLSLAPVIPALAAGNTAIIKPSELALNSSHAMAKIINENFDAKYFHVVEGGVEETKSLLKEKFDKIFYTGSSKVGKIIMKTASENLTPVTLELGGKSPCFVFNDANLKISAQRIVWAKFLNGGQTCVAPDYILAEKGVKEKLIAEIKNQIVAILGDDPKNSESFVRIISLHHYNRILQLVDFDKIIIGGKTDEDALYIEPTVMDNVSFDDAIMQDEIFGPILPIVEFENLDQTIKIIKDREKPLALYIFTSNKKNSNKILHEISFGGGAVNEAVMHLANSNLPFGGVGYSGMGSYHGKAGFDCFTHYKSILDKSTMIEPPIKYAPYLDWKRKLLQKLLE
ncbi:MAG: aldehyde dehydrogenase [Bacteroidales bacterium]|nr:aldehyde dehydrogenase [Bacteroidales bacterium]